MSEEPRTILFEFKTNAYESIKLGTRSRVLPVLLVSLESHVEAMKIYSKTQNYFSNQHFDGHLSINLDVDTLVFEHISTLAFFFRHTDNLARARVRSLALRTGPGHVTEYISEFFLTHENLVQYLSRCPNLRQFTIVIDRSELFALWTQEAQES